jgi:type VI secretion system secreted protein Hcp
MVDYFLKIDTVPGDSHDVHHRDEIEVISFSWGETNAGLPSGAGGSGAGQGKVHIEDFHFTALTGSASPKLMLLCANGKHVKSAVLVARRPGKTQQEYFKLTFADLMVTSYHVSASTGDVPLDEVTLRFAKIQIDYRPEKATGALGAAVHAGWDVKLNKEF